MPKARELRTFQRLQNSYPYSKKEAVECSKCPLCIVWHLWPVSKERSMTVVYDTPLGFSPLTLDTF